MSDKKKIVVSMSIFDSKFQEISEESTLNSAVDKIMDMYGLSKGTDTAKFMIGLKDNSDVKTIAEFETKDGKGLSLTNASEEFLKYGEGEYKN